MKKKNHKEASLQPITKKTFCAVLMQFFSEHCPQLGGALTQRVIAEKIEELFNEFFPKTTRMRMGQMVWNAVDEKETSGYGKSIAQAKLKPVRIDVVNKDDIAQRLEGKKKRDVRKQQTKRIFEQAKEQGGVLTYTDAGEIIGLSASTIGKYVSEMEKEDGYRLPHRGFIHDMGPTVTHKKQICYKILVEGKSVERVASETNHSPEAITRYVVDYKRIHTCLKQNLSVEETAYCTGRSKRLVAEYDALINKHDPAMTASLQDL